MKKTLPPVLSQPAGHVGAWAVYPHLHCLCQNGQTVHVEPKSMHVLLYLMERADQPVSRSELLETVWMGETVVEGVVARAVSLLRKALEDDYRHPTYIETLPHQGYRLIAPVTYPNATPAEPHPKPTPHLLAAVPPQVWWSTVFGFAIILLLLAFQQAFKPSSSVTPVSMHQEAFTRLSGAERMPAFSPDGAYVAFAYYPDPIQAPTTSQIYIKSVVDGTVIPFTVQNGHHLAPTWSPDGAFIAFRYQADAGCQLMRQSVEGGSPEHITDCILAGLNTSMMGWSPDGTSLIYTEAYAGDAAPQLYSVTLETGERSPLTISNGKTLDVAPHVSPDGSHVLFRRREAREEAYYTVSLIDGALKRLAIPLQSVDRALWDTDGAHVLYTQHRNGLWYIFRTAPYEDTSEPIFSSTNALHNFSYTADPPRLLAEHPVLESNIWQYRLDTTAAPIPLITSTERDLLPSVSPNGAHIAFISHRTSSPQVWLSDRSGQHATRLTDFNGKRVSIPHWSPDSQSLAVSVTGPGTSHIYLINLATRQVNALLASAFPEHQPRWSRDGAWIYFRSPRDSLGWRTWKISPMGGSPTLAPPPEDRLRVYGPNNTIYVINRREGVFVLDQQGEEQRLLTIPDWMEFGRFIPTERGLYFSYRRDQTPFHLARINSHTQTWTNLTSIPPNNYRFWTSWTIPPDGTVLLYEQVERYESDLILVEHFR